MTTALMTTGGALRMRLPTLGCLALLWLVLLLGSGASRADAQTLVETLEVQRQGARLQNGNNGRVAQQAAETQSGNDAEEQPADDAGPEAAGDEGEATVEGDVAAPRIKFDKWDDEHSVLRSKEGFVSWWKLPLFVLAMLMWVRTGDWINRDAQIFELGAGNWNIGVAAAGAVAAALALVLPFAAAFPVALLAGIVPLIAYAVHHNRAVESHQRVFTRDWFVFQIAELAGAVGIKVKTERAADYEKGAAVDLIARGGGDETKDKANLLTARQSPGYVLVKELIAEMVRRRSEQVLLDYRQDDVSVRHQIDGVWHNGESTERDSGDVMLAVMKQLANLKPTERKAKQVGDIGAKYQGTAYDVGFASQGVKTGERVVLKLRDPSQKALSSYADLGMRDKIRDQWAEALGAESGLIVISTPPGGGLTTLTNVSLLETDRLMRDVVAIEDANKPEREIENIAVHTYDAKKGESPITLLERLARLYPNVYVCRDFVDPESAKGLIEEVNEERMVVTSVNASESSEAFLRLLKNKAPHKLLVETAAASLNMRLIRLLCDECKVGYEPGSAMLQKLGIPAGKVEMLYRTPKEEEVKKPCKACNGVGYRGRTGLFELMIVDDKVREVLLKKPKMELLRKVARSSGMRTHQEEGILLVAKGATSIQELQRVLKG